MGAANSKPPKDPLMRPPVKSSGRARQHARKLRKRPKAIKEKKEKPKSKEQQRKDLIKNPKPQKKSRIPSPPQLPPAPKHAKLKKTKKTKSTKPHKPPKAPEWKSSKRSKPPKMSKNSKSRGYYVEAHNPGKQQCCQPQKAYNLPVCRPCMPLPEEPCCNLPLIPAPQCPFYKGPYKFPLAPRNCSRCCCPVYPHEAKVINGYCFHPECFTCANPRCKRILDMTHVYPSGCEVFCIYCGPKFFNTAGYRSRGEHGGRTTFHGYNTTCTPTNTARAFKPDSICCNDQMMVNLRPPPPCQPICPMVPDAPYNDCQKVYICPNSCQKPRPVQVC